MKVRGLFALALGVASAIACSASAGVAAPAAGGSVTVRQGQWVGLQINIATLRRGGGFAVNAAQANGSVTSLRPVAQMCQGCVVAVNGDYFDLGTSQPIGGVIIDGEVLRSPNPRQNQLTFAPNGSISAGYMQWTGRISSGPLNVPVAVNDPGAGTPVLYDRSFGTTTPPGPAMELAFALRPAALRLGENIHVTLKGTHAPGGVIPRGEVVLRATGAFAPQMHRLQSRLQHHKTATLHLATDPMAKNSLGANHILVKNGQLYPIDEHDAFADGGQPRTLFGWDARGHVTLVTIGSAEAGSRAGVSLPVAAQLMKNLGMTNAVNLDGGGSSTFVSRGRILNHPSDGFPRPVTNAWIVVARRAPNHASTRHRAAAARATAARGVTRRRSAQLRRTGSRAKTAATRRSARPATTTRSRATATSTLPQPVTAISDLATGSPRHDERMTATGVRCPAATASAGVGDGHLPGVVLGALVAALGIGSATIGRSRHRRARSRRHPA